MKEVGEHGKISKTGRDLQTARERGRKMVRVAVSEMDVIENVSVFECDVEAE